jgi:hypothetical protein
MFEGLRKRISNYGALSRRLMANQKKYNMSAKTNLDKAVLERENQEAQAWFANLGGKY